MEIAWTQWYLGMRAPPPNTRPVQGQVAARARPRPPHPRTRTHKQIIVASRTRTHGTKGGNFL